MAQRSSGAARNRRNQPEVDLSISPELEKTSAWATKIKESPLPTVIRKPHKAKLK